MDKPALVKKDLAPVSPAEAPAWGGFLYVHATLFRRLDEELKEAHQLSFSAFEVLILLARAPEQRMRLSDLATSVVSNATWITRLIDRLSSQGLVKRERSTKDRREYYAVLTEAGLQRLSVAYPMHLASVRAYFLEQFTDLELSTLAAFWERIVPGASHVYPYEGDKRWLKDVPDSESKAE